MIQIINLSKIYPVGDGVQANKEINLTLPDRGMIFFTGRSASGKSTLLNLIGGLDSPSSGSIIVDGTDIAAFKERELDCYRADKTAFVFQEFELFGDRTVSYNLRVACTIKNKKATDAQIGEILMQVGLQGTANRKCNELSGGQKQRVAIARALITSAEIILADEPTGNLDSKNAEDIFGLLKKISETKLVLISTHDTTCAKRYADQIITLADGEVACIEEISKTTTANRQKYEIVRKHKLGISTQLNFALKNNTKRIFKSIFTVILSAVAFMLFCVTTMLISYDEAKSLVNSLYDNRIYQAEIYKDTKLGGEYHHDYIDYEEIASLRSKTDIPLYPVYTLGGRGLHTDVGGLMELPAEKSQLEKYGVNVVEGVFPQDYRSFMLSKEFALQIVNETDESDRYNYSSYFGKDVYGLNYQELVGLTVSANFIGEALVDGTYQQDYAPEYGSGVRYTISGIAEAPWNQVFAREGFMNSLTGVRYGQPLGLHYLLFRLPENHGEAYRLFELLKGIRFDLSEGETGMFIDTDLSVSFKTVYDSYRRMATIFGVASLIVFLFSVLLIYFLISDSVRDNKRVTGLYRCLGASRWDIFIIYVLQMMMLNIIIIPVALLGAYYTVIGLNELLKTSVASMFSLITFSAYNFIFTAVICLIASFIAVAIPLFRYRKMKPIGLIKRD